MSIVNEIKPGMAIYGAGKSWRYLGDRCGPHGEALSTRLMLFVALSPVDGIEQIAVRVGSTPVSDTCADLLHSLEIGDYDYDDAVTVAMLVAMGNKWLREGWRIR